MEIDRLALEEKKDEREKTRDELIQGWEIRMESMQARRLQLDSDLSDMYRVRFQVEK